ncbi:MAG: tRNA pseudouridine(55) synthase TruB [Chloroflexi bacterium]|nr:tRNA pseudouridine(55) synthase TruB [Chloroflexota bacterium]
MDAIFTVDKPVGPTSHNVVARIRRASGQRRVGHAGTLDPLASGVLVIALGTATRLLEYLTSDDKTYVADVTFGVTTRTYDREGDVVTRTDPAGIDATVVESQLDRFRGTIQQRPPAFSAVSVNGKRMYDLARRGIEVEIPVRTVTISSLTLDEWTPPTARLTVTCTKGTYIRSLAHDIGESTGVGAHLSGLRRTRSGRFVIDDAPALEDLLEALRQRSWHRFATSPETAIDHLPTIHLSLVQARDIDQGRPILAAASSPVYATNPDGPRRARALDPEGRLAAIVTADPARPDFWRPEKVFHTAPTSQLPSHPTTVGTHEPDGSNTGDGYP